MGRSYTEFTTDELRYMERGLALFNKNKNFTDVENLRVRLENEIRYRANKYGE